MAPRRLDELNVGVAGCGWFCTRAHLPALAALEVEGLPRLPHIRVRVVALCSRSRKSLARAEAALGHEAQRYTQLEAMLKDDRIRAVVLVLPIPMMADAVEMALLAGKHVISEKPIAASLERSLSIFTMHCDLPRHVPDGDPAPLWLVSENWAFKQSCTWLRQKLAEGAIGNVTSAHCEHVDILPPKGWTEGWRSAAQFEGGWFLDVGVHWLRLLRLLLGEASLVSATVCGPAAGAGAAGGFPAGSPAQLPPQSSSASASASASSPPPPQSSSSTSPSSPSALHAWLRFDGVATAVTLSISFQPIPPAPAQRQRRTQREGAGAEPSGGGGRKQGGKQGGKQRGVKGGGQDETALQGEESSVGVEKAARVAGVSSSASLTLRGERGLLRLMPEGGSADACSGVGARSHGGGTGAIVELEVAGEASRRFELRGDDWISGGVAETLRSALHQVAIAQGFTRTLRCPTAPLPFSGVDAPSLCAEEALRDAALLWAMLHSATSGAAVSPATLLSPLLPAVLERIHAHANADADQTNDELSHKTDHKTSSTCENDAADESTAESSSNESDKVRANDNHGKNKTGVHIDADGANPRGHATDQPDKDCQSRCSTHHPKPCMPPIDPASGFSRFLPPVPSPRFARSDASMTRRAHRPLYSVGCHSAADAEAALAHAVHAKRRLRCVGARHSWSGVADAADEIAVEMEPMRRVLAIDVQKRTVRVEAGLSLRALSAVLAARGLTLGSYPMLLDQTVGGAISTGSHGSSARDGTISDSVVAIRILTSDGTWRDMRERERPRLGSLQGDGAGFNSSLNACMHGEAVPTQHDGARISGCEHQPLTSETANARDLLHLEQCSTVDAEIGASVDERTPDPDLHLRAARLSCGILGCISEVELQCESEYYIRRHVHVLTPLALAERCSALLLRYRHVLCAWRLGASQLAACCLEDLGCLPHHDARLYNGANWWDSAVPFQAPREAAHPDLEQQVVLPGDALLHQLSATSDQGTYPSTCTDIRPVPYSDTSSATYPAAHEKRRDDEVRWYSMQYSLPLPWLTEACLRLSQLALEHPALRGREVEIKFVSQSGATLIGPNAAATIFCINVHWPLRASEIDGLRVLEDLMHALGAWPHLGKLHNVTEKYAAAAFPRLGQLRAVADELDPQGIFWNSALSFPR